MRRKQLQTIFESAIIRALKASTVVGALSCVLTPNADPSAEIKATGPLRLVDCEDQNSPFYIFSGIKATTSFDYIFNPRQEFFTGEPCKTAQDREQCLRRFNEVSQEGTQNVFIITRGDEVIQVTRESPYLREFLGVIDSPSDAALIAYQNNFPICYNGATVGEASGGYVVKYDNNDGCPPMTVQSFISLDGSYQKNFSRVGEVCVGRRPAGLCEPGDAAPKTPGEFFARAAWQESVSVPAFLLLARDLSHLGAPRSLIQRAKQAAQDERRHTKKMSRLAARFGAEVSIPKVEETKPKSALSLALENMREGCINETFAALLASYQSKASPDLEVRREMTSIARDEAQHAALSFEVHSWLFSVLSVQERSLVAQERTRSIERLKECPEELPTDVASEIGFPSPSQQALLVAHLDEHLWSA